MILPVHDALRARLATVLGAQYNLSSDALPADHDRLRAQSRPRRSGAPGRVRARPPAPESAAIIAQELAAALPPVPGIARIEATPNGYLNCFLDRPAFLTERLTSSPTAASLPAVKKAIVEHTAINPNKAAHIGHLRNAALGDTLVRVLRFRGTPVEVQNYIDDTGVQVADVVVGLTDLEPHSLDEVRQLAETSRFDYFCWDLYARVTEWYAQDKERLATRAAALHDIEHGVAPRAAIAALVADRIVRCHLRTMERMNIEYDLLTWEGDILRLQFWARAFSILKAQGTVYLQDKGRLAGCWVMPIDDGQESAPADTETCRPERRG